MPLKGLKVVELAGIAPAAFCSTILSDFGATIIRVTSITPNEPEELECLNNGKKTLAIDLKKPKAKEILHLLCKQSDVLIEPYRKGIMEKLGLGPDVLLQENPGLVYARLTGYGQFGKYSNRVGHDINFISMSGLLSVFGRSGQKPVPPLSLSSVGAGGLTCALGILLALLERTNSGKGQIIDSSAVHATAYMGSWIFHSQQHGIWKNSRGNNLYDTGKHFYEVYETKDGKFMSVGAAEPHFYKELIQGLGLSKEDVPQFGDTMEAKSIFTKIFKSKTQNEWCQIFDFVDACVTPVLSLKDAAKHPHNYERKSFTELGDSSEILVPNPAPILSRSPGKSKAGYKSPLLGEHTHEILSTLNYSNEDIESLIQEKVVKICDSLTK